MKQYDIQDIILLMAINSISLKKLVLDLPWVVDGVIASEIAYFNKVGFLKCEGDCDWIKTTEEGKKKLLAGGLGILRTITPEDVKHPEKLKFSKPKR